MNAHALVGKVLGSSALQRVIGQGSTGAVYLAQQSHPYGEGQVAVKVFLRASKLDPLQYIDFLVRFQREMDAVAKLKHPHILPVYDYGEYDGFVYLVMPYVVGETLSDILARRRMLSFAKVIHYLEQLAEALDYAHKCGVIHQDLKPANILVTVEDKLLLTDFALTKAMPEEIAARMRLFTVGMLDYMSPEQVTGKDADKRSDLYSLGATLYHMATGTAPFQGESLMEVAKKHLQVPPRSPSSMRVGLPIAAEQVMLRALAKRPADRYAHAEDLATAFRLALDAADEQEEHAQHHEGASSSSISGTGFYSPQGLFDSKRSFPAATTATASSPSPGGFASFKKAALRPEQATDSDEQVPISMRVTNPNTPVQDLPLIPTINTNTSATLELPGAEQEITGTVIKSGQSQLNSGTEARSDFRIKQLMARSIDTLRKTPIVATFQKLISLTMVISLTMARSIDTLRKTPIVATFQRLISLTMARSIDTLNKLLGKLEVIALVIKLAALAKVASVYVGGQLGRYAASLLSVLPTNLPIARLRKHLKLIGLVMVVLLVFGSGTFWFTHMRSGSTGGTYKSPAARTPVVGATLTAQAGATANANITLTDPLSRNIHNWPILTGGPMIYEFVNGAYHITNNDSTRVAPAILPGLTLKGPFAYTLTMEEIKGDDTSVNNEFGMIFRARIQNTNSRTISTFYSFEVLNKPGGEYQFWKYDDSKGTSVTPWTQLWHHDFGNEFHEGQGPKSINIFKIFADGKTFTLQVNGKQVGTVQDSSFASGQVGMLVNLKGTEVAFSNLKLIYG
jgi:serine/threonine protein kinase